MLRRRAPEHTDDAVEIAGLRLDPATHRVIGDGREIALGPTEFRMLHFFMTHPERVHSRAQLLDRVWGDHVFVEERTVDVHIRRLRQALEASGHDRLIETVRSSGYRMREGKSAAAKCRDQLGATGAGMEALATPESTRGGEPRLTLDVNPLLRAALTLAVMAASGLLAGGLGARLDGPRLALGALALLAYHVAKRVRALASGSGKPRPRPVPEARGAWDEAFALSTATSALRRPGPGGGLTAHRRALAPAPRQAMPDGVGHTDAQNRIEWCNEGASRHFGLDLRADPGRPVDQCARRQFAAYIEAEDYAHAIPLRSEHGGGLVLSLQVIPYGQATSCCSRAISPGGRRSRRCAAISSRTSRTS